MPPGKLAGNTPTRATVKGLTDTLTRWVVSGERDLLPDAVFLDRVRVQLAAEYRKAVDRVVGRVVGSAADVDRAVIIEDAAGEASVADLFLGPLVPQHRVIEKPGDCDPCCPGEGLIRPALAVAYQWYPAATGALPVGVL